jgi:dTDP-4-dehydrorhamnose reductase
MKKVLILGVTGMLGSMVYDYFEKMVDMEVVGTSRKKTGNSAIHIFDVETDDINELIIKIDPDYIINCIGVINIYCRDEDSAGTLRAIKINALFPYHLSEAAKTTNAKIIQIATDCVFSGSVGSYSEDNSHDASDVYGKTKSLGEVKTGRFLNIRCSIIGPEKDSKHSLLEWFLNQSSDAKISGYKHHKWNGVTTLQFAQLCEKIIKMGDDYFKKLISANHTHHYIPNVAVSKYELLEIFKDVYRKDIEIIMSSGPGAQIDRTLSTKYELLSKVSDKYRMKEAVRDLKRYTQKNNFYNKTF